MVVAPRSLSGLVEALFSVFLARSSLFGCVAVGKVRKDAVLDGAALHGYMCRRVKGIIVLPAAHLLASTR